MTDEKDDKEVQDWQEAWEWRESKDKQERAKKLEDLRQMRSSIHLEAMNIEAALAELEGRGDWTTLFKPLKQFDWLNTVPPPRQALLEKNGDCVLPLGKVGFFVGEGGIGKSWALTQLAISVATGVNWLQTFNVPSYATGGVVMAMGEEDPDEMHRRIRNILDHLNLPAHHLSALEQRIFPLPLAGYFVEFLEDGERSFAHERFEQILEQNAPDDGWKLIVLDPASRFMGVDAEKDNAYATRFVQLLERLTSLPGHPTVLCAHHTTKSARAGGPGGGRSIAARGASALTDGARWQGNLFAATDESTGEPMEDMAVFTVSKSNYGPKPATLYLKRKEGSGVLIPAISPTQDNAVEMMTSGPSSYFSDIDGFDY